MDVDVIITRGDGTERVFTMFGTPDDFDDGTMAERIVASIARRLDEREVRHDCAACGQPIFPGDGARWHQCDGRRNAVLHAWCVVTCPGSSSRDPFALDEEGF